MIQLRDVYKKYGSSVVLDSVSMDFEESHLYVIKGISGCGKTTLLNVIGCIDNKYEGSYFYNGKNLQTLKKEEIALIRSEIGYIYQDSLLFQHLSVFENLSFFSNENEKIVELAKQFNVADLLMKVPNELSNGESQRISIIRALLGDKKAILADEPTASLDRDRAKEIVAVFEILKQQGYLIIVVTHDDVFDDVADNVIKMNYGKMELIYEERDIEADNKWLAKTQIKGMLSKDLNYSKKRFKKVGVGTFLSLILIFVIILLSISVRLHFEDQYASYVKGMYPSHVFSMYTDKPYDLGDESKYTIYKDLGFYGENSIIYALLPETDSSLSIPDAIKIGEFPKKENEVVINVSYWKHNLPNKKTDNIIGSKVHIARFDKDFVVAGVLSDDVSLLELVYQGCPFYDVMRMEEASVFVDYEVMMRMDAPVMDATIEMVSYPTLESNEDIYLHLKNLDVLFWENMITSNLYGMNLILNIVFICIAILLVIAYLFIFNMIKYELFNRKREIGFLQLFGVKKKRIFRIVLLEHVYKVVVPYIIAIGAYYLIVLILHIYIHVNITLSLMEWVVVTMAIFAYIYLIIRLPFHKMSKRNILQLINRQ